MVVIVGILKLWTAVLFLCRGGLVEMRMHLRCMIVIRSWMDMLKRRDKECQQ